MSGLKGWQHAFFWFQILVPYAVPSYVYINIMGEPLFVPPIENVGISLTPKKQG